MDGSISLTGRSEQDKGLNVVDDDDDEVHILKSTAF
jgi:hypothetical protein